MHTHEFTGFKLESVINSPQAPMILIIDGAAFCNIELPSTGAFHIYPPDNGADYHLAMFKMNSATSTPPEVSFHVLVSELEAFKRTSVLPVLENS
ncbi:hypothetical protein AB8I23_004204 [Vibrio alginolyticus]|nr:hypothetical protein [Vibrio parahaemolyticus]EJC7127698.1 hypothetical protein [Vibrio parahaemolyticus]